MTFNKRVDALETSLQPERTILQWLDRMAEGSSPYTQYESWFLPNQLGHTPLDALIGELDEVKNSESTNKDAGARKRRIVAVEDLVYRFHLVWALNLCAESFLSECHLLLCNFELMNPKRSPPIPMSEDMASIVCRAAEGYVMPLDQLFTKLQLFIAEHHTEISRGWIATPEAGFLLAAKIIAAVAVSGAADDAVWIDLGQLPYRSLGRASLVEGQWIDSRILELAEYAALLRAQGLGFRKPAEYHPLEELTPVSNDGHELSASDLLAIRKEAKTRLCSFKARTRTIDGQKHLNFDDYRNWDSRAVVGALEASPGIKVACWNKWLDSRGQKSKEIEGMVFPRFEAPFSSRDVLECKGEEKLRSERRARQQEMQRIGRLMAGSITSGRPLGDLRFALWTIEWVGALVDKVRQLFAGRQVLFKQNQHTLDQLIRYTTKLGWACDLLDHSEQREGRSSGGVELDSVLGPESNSELMLKSTQIMAKYATFHFFGHTEAADKTRHENLANRDAHFEAAKSRIKALRTKESAAKSFGEHLNRIAREGGTKLSN